MAKMAATPETRKGGNAASIAAEVPTGEKNCIQVLLVHKKVMRKLHFVKRHILI